LAVEFGWWGLNNDKYGHVFFVSSETPKLLNTSLARLAGAKVLVSKSLFHEILERIKRLKPVPIGLV